MHHPPHIYLDESWYIITASTLNHTPFLASGRAKALVRDKLKELIHCRLPGISLNWQAVEPQL